MKFPQSLPGEENSSAGASACGPAYRTICNHGSTIKSSPLK